MSKKNKKELKISQEEMLNSISSNSKLDKIHDSDDTFFQFTDSQMVENELKEKKIENAPEIFKEKLFGKEETVPLKNTIKAKVGFFDSFKKDFLPKLEFILSPRPAFGVLGAAILIFFVFNIIPDNSIENINNPNSLIFRSAEYSKDELVYVQIENKNLVVKQFDDLDRVIKIYKDDKLIIQKGFSDLEETNNEMMITFALKDGSYKLIISFLGKILFEKNFIIAD